MSNFPSFVLQKCSVILFFAMLTFVPFAHRALSQEVIPSFKIIGETRLPIFPETGNERVVEYAPYGSDHLLISLIDSKGVMLEKTQYRFKGKKFKLSALQDYLSEKVLLKDGIHKTFYADQSVATEMIYKNDTLREQSSFYNSGKKQMTFTGKEKMLDGEFSMWHPNGQISFLGRYHNNLKDGEFESIDEAGKLVKKGTYQSGKLIAGEPVVQDLVYDSPEVPARYQKSDSIFNLFLAQKTAAMAKSNLKQDEPARVLDITFTIDKTGKINQVEILHSKDPISMGIVNAVFNKDFEGFLPARMEGVAVDSYLKKSFLLSCKGLEAILPAVVNTKDHALTDVRLYAEQMPEFPGGQKAYLKFLMQNLKYPAEATKNKIQGKVLVNFIILEDGSVCNPTIQRSAHPALDAEAIRIVSAMPRWIPGKQEGKPVMVSYTIPINFVTF